MTAAEPPLRLRALARIVDDERVDVGQGAEHGSGKQSADSASALPGSHSRLPCLPMWTIACAPNWWRSQA